MTIEPRVGGLARRLARSEPMIASSTVGRQANGQTAYDGIARALAAPVTRRRAVLVMGAVVATGTLLRPGSARAQNCYPGGPKVCSSGGKRVCVPNDLACCSNENCAIACPHPWRDCEAAANCADTPRMCSDPQNPDYERARTKFCSKRIPVTNGCVAGGTSLSVRGWCCEPTKECGAEFGECACQRPCGSDCCKEGSECASLGLFRGSQCVEKCRQGWRRVDGVCVCEEGQTCGVNCCRGGSVCVGGSYCGKPKAPDKAPSLFDAFDGFFDTANQSAASHGGGSGSMRRAVAASAGIAQSNEPVDAVLLALATVNAQGAAVGGAFSGGPVERGYKRKVRASRPLPPRIPANTGLAPRAVLALEKLMTTQTKGFALAMACATAVARAQGATRKRDLRTARRQTIAAAGFAKRAARELGSVPSLRSQVVKALRSTGASEVTASSADVLSHQSVVRATGLPADLRGQLSRLGVRGNDLEHVRTALLAQSKGGPTLIGPLADPVRTRNIELIAKELTRFSRSVRRGPIARTRGLPKRYRPRTTTQSAP